LPDGIDVKALIAQALHMGDEGHNRNRQAPASFSARSAQRWPAPIRITKRSPSDRVHRPQRSLVP